MDNRISRTLILEGYQRLDEIINDDNSNRDLYDLAIHMKEHMRKAMKRLKERDRFVIENEVVFHKSGKWYRDFYSESAYRTCRKQAYTRFSEILNQ